MSGPLEGFVGTIRELDEVGQRAKVDIVMFGRPQDVEVDYVQMERVSAELPESDDVTEE